MDAALIDALAPRDAPDWERSFRAAGVPAACLQTLDAALAMPQIAARRFLATMGDAAVPTLPFRIGGQTPVPATGPRSLGADTAEVLAELGLPDA